MSRAFTKERDDAPEPTAEDAVRRAMQKRRDEAVAEPAVPADRSRVGYGAIVTVSGVTDAGESTFTIVGEDETDVRHGKISFTSPLAEALMGKRAGQEAVWHRPAGDRKVTVKSIRYEE